MAKLFAIHENMNMVIKNRLKNLGINIKSERLRKGISQEELDMTLATLEKIRFNLKDEFTMQI